MNLAFKLVIFSICLNFATGLMYLAIPALNPAQTSGLFYDSNYSDELTVINGKIINPDPVATDTGNANVQLLDLISLGGISNLLKAISKLLYGFPNMLQSIFGSWMPENMSNMIFGAFKTLITIAYICFGIYLWTGRRLNEDK